MRVLLVNMPCSSIRPPLGLGLLKSHMAQVGVEARVFNANLRLARRTGPHFYHYVSDVSPVEALLGEWLFSHHVFPDRPAHDYPDQASRTFGGELPAEAVARLHALRAQTGDFLDECLEVVLASGADLVGFTSSFAQNMASLALARRVKERRPEVTIAFGGANCEDVMGRALHRAFPFVDLVFCGEADISAPRALLALSEGLPPGDVPGVIARGPDGRSAHRDLTPERVRDLDTLPYPDYDDFFDEYAALRLDCRVAGLPLESSRGCWWGAKHHCTFCGLNGLSMTYRSKTPDRFLDELDTLTARYGIRDVQLVDNILDMGYLRTVLPALAAHRHRPALFYQTKANLTREHLEMLRAGGVRAIQPGIESLDTRVLRIMRKGTTGIRSVELLRDCRELGLWPHWNILYGFPGEPADAYDEMARTVPALAHLDPPNVCTRIRLDRFSPLFTGAADAGLTDLRPAAAYRALYDLPDADLGELAYYFDHDYADGRDPSAYASSLSSAVGRWQRAGSGDLLLKDDGERLRLIDTRGARTAVTELDGAERELYLACRSPRTTGALEDEFEGRHRLPSGRVRTLLEGWQGEGLVLTLDERHLALAIDIAALKASRARRKPSWSAVREDSLTEGARPRLFGAPARALVRDAV